MLPTNNSNSIGNKYTASDFIHIQPKRNKTDRQSSSALLTDNVLFRPELKMEYDNEANIQQNTISSKGNNIPEHSPPAQNSLPRPSMPTLPWPGSASGPSMSMREIPPVPPGLPPEGIQEPILIAKKYLPLWMRECQMCPNPLGLFRQLIFGFEPIILIECANCRFLVYTNKLSRQQLKEHQELKRKERKELTKQDEKSHSGKLNISQNGEAMAPINLSHNNSTKSDHKVVQIQIPTNNFKESINGSQKKGEPYKVSLAQNRNGEISKSNAHPTTGHAGQMAPISRSSQSTENRNKVTTNTPTTSTRNFDSLINGTAPGPSVTITAKSSSKLQMNPFQPAHNYGIDFPVLYQSPRNPGHKKATFKGFIYSHFVRYRRGRKAPNPDVMLWRCRKTVTTGTSRCTSRARLHGTTFMIYQDHQHPPDYIAVKRDMAHIDQNFVPLELKENLLYKKRLSDKAAQQQSQSAATHQDTNAVTIDLDTADLDIDQEDERDEDDFSFCESAQNYSVASTLAPNGSMGQNATPSGSTAATSNLFQTRPSLEDSLLGLISHLQ